MKLKRFGMLLLCLLAGAGMAFAFAPFDLYWLALVLPAILCASWLNVSPRQALLRGWLFGFGFALTGGSWIFVSMHTYGGDSILVASAITALLAAILAFYPALQGYCFKRFFPQNRTTILLAFPALWVTSEWLRAHLFTGVPWLLLGYSQINSPFAGFAPIDSVYLVSLVVALISALMVTFFRCKGIYAYLCILAILLLTMIGMALKPIQWTHPISKPISVALVQGNIPQQTKWDPAEADATLSEYATLTEQHWNSPLIFWPESAIPFLLSDAKPFVDDMNREAKIHHSAILFGIPIKNQTTNDFYNGAMVVGNGRGLYYKHHLLPFGEYIPLKPWIGNALEFLTIPMSGFSAGAAVQPLMDMQNLHVALFICFESAFPTQVRNQLQEANFIVTISDDGWFGRSLGPFQHEQIDQMRALETGRYVVRVTNNGVTGIINGHGQVIAKAPMNQTTVLTESIVPVNGDTPWSHFGLFPLLCLIVLMLLVAWLRRP